MIDSREAVATLENDADAYQDAILPKVSRTFALTIPQLPPELRRAVSNAYLLCRVADTIEDEPALSIEQKRDYENAFVKAVTGDIDSHRFADDVAAKLSHETLDAERDLLKRLPLVLQVTQSLARPQRAAIVKCLKVMSHGMHDFQRTAGLQGLDTLHDLDRYCYCVAGVVGEMLTELFVDFEPALKADRDTMLRLSVSFGQGLQMTNIIKDQWEDRSRGACWLPRDMFARRGLVLAELHPGMRDARYDEVMTELIGVAHSHLRQALDYTLMIPTKHVGIRRFCLWAIGLAILTLRNVYKRLDFLTGADIKVSRNEVARTIMLTRLSSRSNAGLRWLFKMAARNLPLTPLTSEWSASAHARHAWPKSSIPYLADMVFAEPGDVESAKQR